jgi:LuxR family transcriptional regulator, quorum-sensing system regulator BjaR1
MTTVAAYEEAFDFIAHLDGIPDPDGVAAGATGKLERYGITNLIFTGLPKASVEGVVLAARWPAELLKLYVRSDFIRFDPIARRCRLASQPFEWMAAQYSADREPRTAEIMRRRAEFGLAHGFAVPINTPDGFAGGVSMAGTHIDLTEHTKPLMHIVALYGYERVRQLTHREPPAKAQLTPRELEVLQWVARGKSAWEIGEILDIGKRTVEEHAAAAVRKLGAVNRPHAIARALREELIEL